MVRCSSRVRSSSVSGRMNDRVIDHGPSKSYSVYFILIRILIVFQGHMLDNKAPRTNYNRIRS